MGQRGRSISSSLLHSQRFLWLWWTQPEERLPHMGRRVEGGGQGIQPRDMAPQAAVEKEDREGGFEAGGSPGQERATVAPARDALASMDFEVMRGHVS